MKTETVKWNKFPDKKTNFTCEIKNSGIWENNIHNKWICLFAPKGNVNAFGTLITAPTTCDIINYLQATLECEKRNDTQNYIYTNKPQNYIYEKNTIRPKEKWKKLNEFKNCLDEIQNQWIKEDIKNGKCN
jgi:hypothetical protein